MTPLHYEYIEDGFALHEELSEYAAEVRPTGPIPASQVYPTGLSNGSASFIEAYEFVFMGNEYTELMSVGAAQNESSTFVRGRNIDLRLAVEDYVRNATESV